MTLQASLSARQAFVAGGRRRASRRGRTLRLAALVLMAGAFTSCVMQPPLATAVAPILTRSGPAIAAGTTQSAAAPTAPDFAPVAGPSFLAGLDQRDRMRATLCLASAIYYEAATEPDEGQRAVAQVVLNRVRHPEWPNTICGVVYQGSDRPGCQFSFACDGAMARGPMIAHWIRARRHAEAALAGDTYAPVGSATFYHTLQVAPAWRLRMTPVTIVGAHIFYRLPGDAAGAETLPFAYAGREPTPGPLPRVVLPADLLRVAAAPPIPVVLPRPIDPVQTAQGRTARSRVAPSHDTRYLPGALPDSDIRPEWRDSGTWIAPAR